ncbi:hypothetical protein [Catellatospora tritici]|uniref:hypothetical protein n=1 Tax=Catellatospora tritici TaxID=2851566 RepID=UPI001C2D9EC8|nr:hypothetical protein [Catellatospora tritici]MBV1850493.1 hypothetical protein [Catellatospora tritici]
MNVVRPTYHNVSHGQGGCWYCSPRSDPNEPGIVYLVYSTLHDAIKVGIMAARSGRLDQHRRNGWMPWRDDDAVTGIWNLPTVLLARTVEREILSWWRDDMQIPPAVSWSDMPQAGATETASATLADPAGTAGRIARLVAAIVHNRR